MTLNLSLVTSRGIHQSADFRLTDLTSKQSISNHSAKVIQLRYQDWFASLTYCGIGKWEGRDTYEWLSDWLKHEWDESKTIDEVIHTIQSQGTKWLQRISRQLGYMPIHSFVLAGFSSGNAIIALISNFERVDADQRTSPLPSLEISQTVVKRSRLVINGIPQAVADKDKKLLKSLDDPTIDIEEIQRILAQVNARASSSRKSQGGISESCWAYSLMPDGYSSGRYFGEVKGKLDPLIIQNGVNFLEMIDLIPAPGRQIQMTNVTFVTAESLQSKETIKCSPSVAKPDFPNSIRDISIYDVGDLGGSTARAKAINNVGIVVGESFLSPSGPSHAFLWTDKGIKDLGTLGGPSSIAQDINDSGNVIGSSINHEGNNRAFLWTRDKGMLDLGTLGGRHSNASAINSLGNVVGSSWTIPGESPANPVETAFLWSQATGMLPLGTLTGDWSRALDINDRNEVIGISPVRGFTRGFIWDDKSGMQDIGTLGGDTTEALAINNRGEVIGMSETKSREYRPFIWTKDTELIEIPITGKVYIRDINDQGYIVGDIETRLGTRSFMWREDVGLR